MTAFVKCHPMLGLECQYNKGSQLEMSGALKPSLLKLDSKPLQYAKVKCAYHYCEAEESPNSPFPFIKTHGTDTN